MERSKSSAIFTLLLTFATIGALALFFRNPVMPPAPHPWLATGGAITFLTILFVGIGAYLFYKFLWATPSTTSISSTVHSEAEEILKKRYARGEISDEEFEKMLEKLRK